MSNSGRLSGSREPDPSFTGSGPSGFDPERIEAEIRKLAEQTDRYRDLYGDHIEFIVEGAISRALHELADVFDAIATEAQQATTAKQGAGPEEHRPNSISKV